MSDEDKIRLFKEVIEEENGQSEHCDRIVHGMLNIRASFMILPHFRKLAFHNQYVYCHTAYMIATHTILQHLDEHRPLSKPKGKYFRFSVNRDWKVKPKTPIDSFQTKKLN